MEKILVTTDLSANSKAGIRFALQLASQTGCELVFCHIIEIMKPTSWSAGHYAHFVKRKIEEFDNTLRKFIFSVCTQSGVKPGNYNYMVEIGINVPEVTIRLAKKNKVSFICLSTHGAGKFQRLIGTNASAFVTTSPIPVIVVPKQYRIKPIKTLFYASDFAALGKEIKIVKQFARSVDANIAVYNYDYMINVPEHLAKLEQKSKKYESKNTSFHFRRLEVEHNLAYHLKAEIEQKKPSLVVLFTKQNRGWFDRLFAGSETAGMAFHSKVPLLTFRKK